MFGKVFADAGLLGKGSTFGVSFGLLIEDVVSGFLRSVWLSNSEWVKVVENVKVEFGQTQDKRLVVLVLYKEFDPIAREKVDIGNVFDLEFHEGECRSEVGESAALERLGDGSVNVDSS